MVVMLIQTQTRMPLLKLNHDAQDLYSYPLPVAAAASWIYFKTASKSEYSTCFVHISSMASSTTFNLNPNSTLMTPSGCWVVKGRTMGRAPVAANDVVATRAAGCAGPLPSLVRRSDERRALSSNLYYRGLLVVLNRWLDKVS